MFCRLLILVAFFGISISEESSCGISPSLERYAIFNPNRIFGGDNSNEGDFPWYIWMYADSWGCSGTIVHKKWILTAAHCVSGMKDITIHYGSVDWKIMKTKKIKPLKYFVHPEYATGKNDIALIELNGTLEYSELVQPVCLDSKIDPYPNEILTICGMGKDFKMRDGKNITYLKHNILQDSPIQQNCNTDNKRKICAGGINHSVLPGDSGGPLMAIRNNRWIQIGISSAFGWERIEDENISMTVQSYFMRVSYYCNWIKETTNNDVQC